jgi:hypothetical protein
MTRGYCEALDQLDPIGAPRVSAAPYEAAMAVTGSEVSTGVRLMVEEKGIAYHPEHVVAEVGAPAR